MRFLTFFLKLVALVGVLAGLFSLFQDQSRTVFSQALQEVAPCSIPVTYRVGAIGKGFGITEKEVVAALSEAADIWNVGLGKSLLKLDNEHGTVVVNFIFDSRQATTEKLKELGVAVGDDRETYEAVKARYKSLYADYEAQKTAFEREVASYKSSQEAYNAEVASWNSKGGAPRDVYQRLQADKSSLASRAQNIEIQQNAVNAEVADVNSLASELNHLIDALNLDVAKYNSTGAANGPEFEEGVYFSSLGKESITIYEYDSKVRLVRVLAHELGHALGLQHVDDSKSIMYKLNQSSNSRLTVADNQALEVRCARR